MTKISLLFTLILMTFGSEAQNLMVHSTNVQLIGKVNDEPISWASDKLNVFINGVTGDFELVIPVDLLRLNSPGESGIEKNPEYEDETIKVFGNLPIADVIDNNQAYIDLPISTRIEFRYDESSFTSRFSITRIDNTKFSLIGKGTFNITDFDLPHLETMEDEMILFFSVVGARNR